MASWLKLTRLIFCLKVHFFFFSETQNKTIMQKKGDYTFPAYKTLPLPPLASSPNTSTSSPGLNVEIVGGSGVLIVMDGSWEDYSKNLQLRQPVLKGRLQSNQIICLFVKVFGLLTTHPHFCLSTLQLPSYHQTHVFWQTEMGFFFSSVRRLGDMWFENSMPSKVEKSKE